MGLPVMRQCRFLRARRRQEDAGVEEPRRIKRGLDRAHGGDLGGAEALPHAVPLLAAHPMLTGDRAAKANRRRGQFLVDLGRRRALRRIVSIEQDDRVQIAVPGMAERGNGDVMARRWR